MGAIALGARIHWRSALLHHSGLEPTKEDIAIIDGQNTSLFGILLLYFDSRHLVLQNSTSVIFSTESWETASTAGGIWAAWFCGFVGDFLIQSQVKCTYGFFTRV